MQKTTKVKHSHLRKIVLITLCLLLVIAFLAFLGTYHNSLMTDKDKTKQQMSSFDKKIESLRKDIYSMRKIPQDVTMGTPPISHSIKDAYLLTRTANISLQQGQNVEVAQMLLQLAVEHLDSINEPKVNEARRVVESDLRKLNNVSVSNMQKVHEQLATLDSLINVMPAQGSEQIIKNSSTASTNKIKKTWQQKLCEAWDDIKGIIKIRKRDTHEISMVEIDIARAQFKLLIEQMRWAVFYKNSEIYVNSIKKARKLLPEVFDMQSESVQKVASILQSLQAYQVNTDVPNIQTSVDAIQAILVE